MLNSYKLILEEEIFPGSNWTRFNCVRSSWNIKNSRAYVPPELDTRSMDSTALYEPSLKLNWLLFFCLPFLNLKKKKTSLSYYKFKVTSSFLVENKLNWVDINSHCATYRIILYTMSFVIGLGSPTGWWNKIKMVSNYFPLHNFSY